MLEFDFHKKGLFFEWDYYSTKNDFLALSTHLLNCYFLVYFATLLLLPLIIINLAFADIYIQALNLSR